MTIYSFVYDICSYHFGFDPLRKMFSEYSL